MNLLDLLILIPIVWGCIRGFSKGLIIELATLAGMVLGIIAAYYFSERVSDFFSGYFTIGPSSMKILSYVLIFLAVLLISWIIGKIITKLVDMVMLGWLNKLLGAIFGLLKGVLVSAIIVLAIVYFDKNEKLITRQAKEKSMFFRALSAIIPDYILYYEKEDKQV
jgi:membrane protein required for colicin V production